MYIDLSLFREKSTKEWRTRGFHMLNIDGSADLQTGPGGMGCVFRNHDGSWELGFYEHLPHTTPLLSEILALRKGLILAKQHNLKPLIVNTDCNAIIIMLKNDHPLYCNILSECRSLLMDVEATTPVYVFRERNQVADCLAREGKKVIEFIVTVSLKVPSMFVQEALDADILGTFFIRFSNKQFFKPIQSGC
ncbi:hypothetical protein FXO38_33996 [Capsicum annuum]|nr:hypothetical protein FXO38_33996 [Capsicum annuum]